MTSRHPVRFIAGASLVMVACMARPAALYPTPIGEDIAKIIARCSQAEPKEALVHLTRVVNILGGDNTLTPAERMELTDRLARVLTEKAHRPDDIRAVLGPQAAKQVVRQLYYRRYLEHWIYDAPVGLCVTLDRAKGQEPVVRAIHPRSNSEPW